MTKLVSIIIPAYNAEPWIHETIESALAQTWPNKEIIIIDDGSTDATLEIAREYSSKNVKIIHQENAGASAARNRGLSEAQGDFIQHLDADDLLAPDKIALQIQTLSVVGNEFIASGSWATFDKYIYEAKFIPEAVWADNDPISWVCCLFERGGWMLPHAWLLSRDILEKTGMWDISLSLNDDREYFTRAVLASAGVRFCAGAKCYWRLSNKASLSKRHDKEAWESAWRVSELNIKSLLKAENSERTKRACATEAISCAVYAWDYYPELAERANEVVNQLAVKHYRLPFGEKLACAARIFGWHNALKLVRVYQSSIKKIAPACITDSRIINDLCHFLLIYHSRLSGALPTTPDKAGIDSGQTGRGK